MLVTFHFLLERDDKENLSNKINVFSRRQSNLHSPKGVSIDSFPCSLISLLPLQVSECLFSLIKYSILPHLCRTRGTQTWNFWERFWWCLFLVKDISSRAWSYVNTCHLITAKPPSSSLLTYPPPFPPPFAASPP